MVNNVNIINNPSLESFHQCQNWPEAHPLGHTTACREGRTMLPESDMIIMAGCGGGHLEAEHEGDPLVVGGVRGLVSRHHALLLHDALEVGLEQHGDNLYMWVVLAPGTLAGCGSCRGSSSSHPPPGSQYHGTRS